MIRSSMLRKVWLDIFLLMEVTVTFNAKNDGVKIIVFLIFIVLVVCCDDKW